METNQQLTPSDILTALDKAIAKGQEAGVAFSAFHFGYPHLLPGCAGNRLSTLLQQARKRLVNLNGNTNGAGERVEGHVVVTSVDLNGVTEANERGRCKVLTRKALEQVDVLHASESEAALICGDENVSGPYDDAFCLRVAKWAHTRGVAVCAITLGAGGSFVSVTSDDKRLRTVRPFGDWLPGDTVRLPAYKIGQTALGSNSGVPLKN